MEYYRLLSLRREPFSNSPDPRVFYESRQHKECLQRLEISIRLKRGLNVVIGEVGAGKTTLCRRLIDVLHADESIDVLLMLDPGFASSKEFLADILFRLGGEDFRSCPRFISEPEYKERIKKELLARHLGRGGRGGKGGMPGLSTVLIVDEGQKISAECLEILREFLNFETNDHKLIQIVIFAQREFKRMMRRFANFVDRVNVYQELKPLNFEETRDMVEYRVAVSAMPEPDAEVAADLTPEQAANLVKSQTSLSNFIAGLDPPRARFSGPALRLVYLFTGGHPRRIVTLCHHALLRALIKGRRRISAISVIEAWMRLPGRSAGGGQASETPAMRRGPAFAAAAAVLLAAVVTPSLIETPLHEWRQLLGQGVMARGPVIAARDEAQPPAPALPAEAPAQPSASVLPAEAPAAQAEGVSLPSQTPTAPVPPVSPVSETQAADGAPSPAAQAVQNPDASKEPGPFFAQPALPANLGEASFEGEPFTTFLQAIYGYSDRALINAILDANPDKAVRKTIPPGTTFQLPVVVTERPNPRRPVHIVALDETATLGDALRSRREMAQHGARVRLVVYSPVRFDRPEREVRYLVALDTIFSNPSIAEARRLQLPPAARIGATVRGDWAPETVFFTRLVEKAPTKVNTPPRQNTADSAVEASQGAQPGRLDLPERPGAPGRLDRPGW